MSKASRVTTRFCFIRRIEELSGLDLRQEDLLSLELALKLARLQATLNK
jgi:hypothetical protein